MKTQYNNLQEELIQNLTNKTELHNIIKNNVNTINYIVSKTGSGNPILSKPYDLLYDAGFYDMASFYLTEIEAINEVALFGEDG